MDKWEKVISAHRLLAQSRHCVALQTIIRELECSEATFHRIRAYMQHHLGAPIIYDRHYNGYRYNNPDGATFELPGLWLTKSEIEALLSLDYAVESLQGGFLREILAPVKNRFEPLLSAQKTTLATLHDRLKIIPIQSRPIDESIFRTVAGAVIHPRRLKIEHAKLTDAEPAARIISPQTLVRYRDNWYLDAFCHLRNDLRTFALDRLTKAEPAPGKHHRVPLQQRETFFAAAYGIFTGPADKSAIIDFTDTAARDVSHATWHPKQQGCWIDPSTYRLTVPYGNSRELIMDILRWGDLAEVKAPEELRNEVQTILHRMIKNYAK
jgi:proteasome accessory factor C